MSIKRHQSGFTLIELLVVIAIIGMLASVVLASLSGARQKGANAARLESVKSLKTALELYYNDNGGYPTSHGSANGDVALSDPTLTAALVPKYLPAMPPQLIADGDHYYGNGVTTGVTRNYDLLINKVDGVGTCRTGETIGTGDWGLSTICPF